MLLAQIYQQMACPQGAWSHSGACGGNSYGNLAVAALQRPIPYGDLPAAGLQRQNPHEDLLAAGLRQPFPYGDLPVADLQA
jgi:hypothetical protein